MLFCIFLDCSNFFFLHIHPTIEDLTNFLFHWTVTKAREHETENAFFSLFTFSLCIHTRAISPFAMCLRSTLLCRSVKAKHVVSLYFYCNFLYFFSIIHHALFTYYIQHISGHTWEEEKIQANKIKKNWRFLMFIQAFKKNSRTWEIHSSILFHLTNECTAAKI